MGKMNIVLAIVFFSPPTLHGAELEDFGDIRLQELFERAERSYTLTLEDQQKLLMDAQGSIQEEKYEKAAHFYNTLFEEGAFENSRYFIVEYLALSYLYGGNLEKYERIILSYFKTRNYQNLEGILKNYGDQKNSRKLKILRRGHETLFPAAIPQDQAHWKL